jgi:hypothetical protein
MSETDTVAGGPPAGRSRPARALLASGLLALLAAALAPAGPARADGALDSAIVSGLPWRSGAACGGPEMEAWRGRRLDTAWFGLPKRGWGEMVRAAGSSALRDRAAAAPQLVVSVPLLPLTHPFQHAQCAAGAFDGHFRDIGAALRANGAGEAVIRLGKEANRGTAPFGYDSEDDLPAYRGCFQHAARALKGAAPDLKIEWTNARQTLSPVNVLDAYPGDDVVDLWGVHHYNNYQLGRITTQAHWDEQYLRRYPSGGPQGLGAWLEEARARGKGLSVSEWGVWGNNGGPADSPVYVANMHRFFRDHAGEIEYESYYNCPLIHQVFPSTRFPRARGEYQRLWSAGR